MASKTSAIADEPIDVLFVLHNKFNLLDFTGPFEALATALHDSNDPTSKAFECAIAGPDQRTLSEQGLIVGAQLSYKDAHAQLSDYDVVVVVGGNTDEILKGSPDAEPFALVKRFAEIQKEDTTRERTLLSVCTGSLLLAKAGILEGLSATTHPEHLTRFENLCSEAAQKNLGERTEVIDDARYVVNNLRFDIGDEDENPYVHKKSDAGRRPSVGRKGSISFQGSSRRESIARRAAMRLGGLRVITSGGVTAGVDAALYLISALVSEDSANEVVKHLQWNWTKGIVVDGLDV